MEKPRAANRYMVEWDTQPKVHVAIFVGISTRAMDVSSQSEEIKEDGEREREIILRYHLDHEVSYRFFFSSYLQCIKNL